MKHQRIKNEDNSQTQATENLEPEIPQRKAALCIIKACVKKKKVTRGQEMESKIKVMNSGNCTQAPAIIQIMWNFKYKIPPALRILDIL